MNGLNYKKTSYNEPFIAQRADPYVYKHTNGIYYFTASVPEYDKIVLRKATTLRGLAKAEEITIWNRHKDGIMSIHIWAPEIHFIKDAWYIYYAAGSKDDIWAIRPYVLECKDADPMKGNWKELGPIKGADAYTFQDFSLDMTVFSHKKEWYCVWAEKVSVGKKISNLYIAKMKAPNQLESQQVLLSSPDYDWERVGFWVNEGPAFLEHGDKIYLTYSASETGTCYCIGMLSANKDTDLLDPKVWKKERQPVVKTDWEKGLIGPGHNSFTKSEDEEDDIMIYHARNYDEIQGNPLYDPNRHTYCMHLQWDEKGKPIFEFEQSI
ncbi:MAG: family 43 glycosylhydrolase [Velocimicrobium sp.]